MSSKENPQIGFIDLGKSDLPVKKQIARLTAAMGKDLRLQVNLHTRMDKDSLEEWMIKDTRRSEDQLTAAMGAAAVHFYALLRNATGRTDQRIRVRIDLAGPDDKPLDGPDFEYGTADMPEEMVRSIRRGAPDAH